MLDARWRSRSIITRPISAPISSTRPGSSSSRAIASFAQAFANTMPYSEIIGFVADTNDPDKIDFATYVTAHEMAHQ